MKMTNLVLLNYLEEKNLHLFIWEYGLLGTVTAFSTASFLASGTMKKLDLKN